jgi:hypothetical protein
MARAEHAGPRIAARQLFPQYTAGVQAAHAAHGWRAPVSVATSGLVIRTGGHMGSFAGQAWLPAALPAGLTGNDIQ